VHAAAPGKDDSRLELEEEETWQDLPGSVTSVRCRAPEKNEAGIRLSAPGPPISNVLFHFIILLVPCLPLLIRWLAYRLQSLVVVARAFEKDGAELGTGMGLWVALPVHAHRLLIFPWWFV
jgi:hypothetical protein